MSSAAARPLFGLILLSFLLPFVSVSCGGVTLVSVTGAELVLGGDVVDVLSADGSTTRVEREPWAIVAAVAAVFGIFGGLGGAGLLFGLGGVGALLALRWTIIEKAGPPMPGMGLEFEPAFWAAMVGFGVAAILSVAQTGGARPRDPTPVRARGRPESLRACPFCEETVTRDAAFCARCGKDISAIPPGVWS